MSNGKMTDIAKKLLGENEPDYLWGDLGFRNGEYDGVTTERLFEFLNSYPVYDVTIDYNSYGEFQFITCKAIKYANDGTPMETGITFWGNGYHEFRKTKMSMWKMNIQTFICASDTEITDKDKIKGQILSRRSACGIPDVQERGNNTFSDIADLADDDYAMMELGLGE